MKLALVVLASAASLAFATPVADPDADLDVRNVGDPFTHEEKRMVADLTARGSNCICLYPNTQTTCNKYCGAPAEKVIVGLSVCCCDP